MIIYSACKQTGLPKFFASLVDARQFGGMNAELERIELSTPEDVAHMLNAVTDPGVKFIGRSEPI